MDTLFSELQIKNLVASNGGRVELPNWNLKFTGPLKRADGTIVPKMTFTATAVNIHLHDDILIEMLEGNSVTACWSEFSDDEKSRLFDYLLGKFAFPDSGMTESVIRSRFKLRRQNLSFIREHGDLDSGDFEKMAKVKDVLEKVRMTGNPVPLPGDTVEGAYYDGKFPFSKGMLDTPYNWYGEDELSLCAQPYSPFTSLTDKRKEGYSFSMSGGPFFRLRKSDVEYVNTDIRLFTIWGHSGPCRNGAIRFPVTVNRWRVKDGVNY